MRVLMLAAKPNRRAHSSDANQSCANSLFRNILPLKYLESRFCAVASRVEPRNSQKTKIISGLRERCDDLRFAAKSLICNILRLKSLESIFCEAEMTLRPCKLKKTRILQDRSEKMTSDPQIMPSTPAKGRLQSVAPRSLVP